MIFMDIKMEDRFKGKGTRKCKLCGTSRGLIRSHDLYICRRCFREVARDIGFYKYG
jgi:small subunit ribosomal protein S14